MKIAFTSATLSHLPLAYTLAKGFLEYNPDYLFYIFLIDPIDSRIDRFKHEKITYESIDSIEIKDFEAIKDVYDISEISFSMKPVLASYLFQKFTGAKYVLYFDSDINVYGSVEYAESLLEKYDMLLTPHFLSPMNDRKIPTELDVLRTGVYNMGFMALKNTENTKAILRWWKERVFGFGYANNALGLSADQMWMNIAPVMFKKVGIIEHFGYNLAFWNIHERRITEEGGKYIVNDMQPLVFIHFAKFNPNKAEHLTFEDFNRILPGEIPIITQLCKDYAEKLLANHYNEYSNIKSVYAKNRRQQAWTRIKNANDFYSLLKYSSILLGALLPKRVITIIRGIALSIIRNLK